MLEETLASIEECRRSTGRCHVKVIVSDNSVDRSDPNAIVGKYPEIAYVWRGGLLDVFEHLKCVFEETVADYVMALHDDDLVLPGLFDAAVAMLESDSVIAAVGFNALLMFGTHVSDRSFLEGLRQPIRLDSSSKLLERYASWHRGEGFAPFPIYCYRVAYLRLIPAPSSDRGGIHADVTLLMDLSSKFQIVMAPDVFMHYRRHATNMSARIKTSHRISWRRFMMENYPDEYLRFERILTAKYLIAYVRENSVRLGCSQYRRRRAAVLKRIMHLLWPDTLLSKRFWLKLTLDYFLPRLR